MRIIGSTCFPVLPNDQESVTREQHCSTSYGGPDPVRPSRSCPTGTRRFPDLQIEPRHEGSRERRTDSEASTSPSRAGVALPFRLRVRQAALRHLGSRGVGRNDPNLGLGSAHPDRPHVTVVRAGDYGVASGATRPLPRAGKALDAVRIGRRPESLIRRSGGGPGR